ncbi:MAG: cupredoxin domain-containing protein, partial [Planctomycetales bacterium]|nr:cupredoxin domain-containing protein [Planctomycetales bacterium]
MLRRVGSFVALIMVATLVLAACGEPDAEVKPTVTRMPVENAPAAPTAVTPAAEATSSGDTAAPTEAAATTAPGGSAMQTTFDIKMVDIAFDVTELVVPANTEITINLVNEGALTHNFSIDELGVNSGDYAAGQTGTVTFNSGAPAEYEYYCNIPGHREAGMVGKITVVAETEAAAPPATEE